MKMIRNDSDTENEFFIYLQISHENVLKYFDHFEHEEDGLDYICIITEYCQGGDLRKKIGKAKKKQIELNDSQRLDWISQATNGLKYLHSKKIIHRDIKPDNLLLTADNMLKLADLGEAKYVDNATVGRTYRGTKPYMSPEQSRGQKLDEDYETHSFNTDIWSLGCVLYELIFFEIAFRSGQENNPDIPNLSGARGFSGVLRKMLEKDPKKRISSKMLYGELLKMANDDEKFLFRFEV